MSIFNRVRLFLTKRRNNMKKFIVEANVRGGMYRPESFSCRKTAVVWAADQFSWHGGEFFINGRRMFSEASKKAAKQHWFS